MKWLRVFLLLPGWDASLSQGYPQHQVRRYPFITWVEGGTVRVTCLAQEHNTMSPPPARSGTQNARSGVERTNHEATARQAFHLESEIFNPIHATEPLCDLFSLTKNPCWIWRTFYWRIEEWFLEIAEKKTTSRQYLQTLKIFLLRIPISFDFPRGILCLKALHFVNLPGFSRSM